MMTSPSESRDEFAARLYRAYPRKVASRAAITAITKALDRMVKAGPDPEQACRHRLERAVTAYAGAVSRWNPDDRRFIPHPSTWFNQERFDDDPSEWERKSTRADTVLDRGSTHVTRSPRVVG